MMGFGVWGMISSAISAIFGGGIAWILMLRIQKRKARADAKNTEAMAESTELNNVEKMTRMWRETAETFERKIDDQRKKLDEQEVEIEKLKSINRQIMQLIGQVTPNNLECIVTQIKNIVEKP